MFQDKKAEFPLEFQVLLRGESPVLHPVMEDFQVMYMVLLQAVPVDPEFQQAGLAVFFYLA